jgi:hypothetical protein
MNQLDRVLHKLYIALMLLSAAQVLYAMGHDRAGCAFSAVGWAMLVWARPWNHIHNGR